MRYKNRAALSYLLLSPTLICLDTKVFVARVTGTRDDSNATQSTTSKYTL